MEYYKPLRSMYGVILHKFMTWPTGMSLIYFKKQIPMYIH